MDKTSITAKWTAEARKALLGRKIVSVDYMTEADSEEMGWSQRGLVLTLDNGEQIIPSSDDEGNNAGALFVGDATLPVL